MRNGSVKCFKRKQTSWKRTFCLSAGIWQVLWRTLSEEAHDSFFVIIVTHLRRLLFQLCTRAQFWWVQQCKTGLSSDFSQKSSMFQSPGITHTSGYPVTATSTGERKENSKCQDAFAPEFCDLFGLAGTLQLECLCHEWTCAGSSVALQKKAAIKNRIDLTQLISEINKPT